VKARDAADAALRPWIEKHGSAGCLVHFGEVTLHEVGVQTPKRGAIVVCTDHRLWAHWAAVEGRRPFRQGKLEALVAENLDLDLDLDLWERCCLDLDQAAVVFAAQHYGKPDQPEQHAKRKRLITRLWHGEKMLQKNSVL
jgi:hypothetical protein